MSSQYQSKFYKAYDDTLYNRRVPRGLKGEPLERFGTRDDVPPESQTAFFKELCNKLSWAIGSGYQKRYSGKNTDVANYARMCAQAIIRDHGYKI